MDIVDINSFFHQIFFSHASKTPPLPSDAEYKLLMIDDSSFFRKIFPPFLKEKGFGVTCVKSALEAIKILEAQPQDFNLIITDINMPGMDGFQFAQVCKADTRLKNIPIIALTSNLEIVNDDEKLTLSGIKACVSKTNRDELIQLIYSILAI